MLDLYMLFTCYHNNHFTFGYCLVCRGNSDGSATDRSPGATRNTPHLSTTHGQSWLLHVAKRYFIVVIVQFQESAVYGYRGNKLYILHSTHGIGLCPYIHYQEYNSNTPAHNVSKSYSRCKLNGQKKITQT